MSGNSNNTDDNTYESEERRREDAPWKLVLSALVAVFGLLYLLLYDIGVW